MGILEWVLVREERDILISKLDPERAMKSGPVPKWGICT